MENRWRAGHDESVWRRIGDVVYRIDSVTSSSVDNGVVTCSRRPLLLYYHANGIPQAVASLQSFSSFFLSHFTDACSVFDSRSIPLANIETFRGSAALRIVISKPFSLTEHVQWNYFPEQEDPRQPDSSAGVLRMARYRLLARLRRRTILRMLSNGKWSTDGACKFSRPRAGDF